MVQDPREGWCGWRVVRKVGKAVGFQQGDNSIRFASFLWPLGENCTVGERARAKRKSRPVGAGGRVRGGRCLSRLEFGQGRKQEAGGVTSMFRWGEGQQGLLVTRMWRFQKRNSRRDRLSRARGRAAGPVTTEVGDRQKQIRRESQELSGHPS